MFNEFEIRRHYTGRFSMTYGEAAAALDDRRYILEFATARELGRGSPG
ncbi:hypothetical protein JJB09_25575 [Rhizobium sp. KVB221]|uniref:Uncharacterized protein n=1 Tax=Rhizobium setariae TaxID=2801340 RepID=A0A936YUH3_9HYPH|nr:hypothetical protein [Rhizobium setariae]MBL0375386.1 hypothetical protein [Rhizobium setariae]